MTGEIWDIFDGNGEPTGKTTLRGRCYLKPGEYHLVVHIWIVSDEGKILIQRRSDDKKLMPGELSGVIKTDYGFFLLRLTAIDESSKESVLGRSIYAAREAAFLPEYEKLFKDASYTIHDSFRSSVILR